MLTTKMGDQFVTLLHIRLDCVGTHKSHPLRVPQPSLRLAQLFQPQLHLVNEISSRFSAQCLGVVCNRRRTAAHKLAGNVGTDSFSWQSLNNATD